MSQETETAEERFRAAFERLKVNAPIRVDKDTPVSQNNVAKEAGTDPTALRKKRYPGLVKDIKDWVDARDAVQVALHKEKRVRDQQRLDNEDLVARLTAERDWAQSQLVGAHRQILELLEQTMQLQGRLDELLPPPVRLSP